MRQSFPANWFVVFHHCSNPRRLVTSKTSRPPGRSAAAAEANAPASAAASGRWLNVS
jgi:hypothetical protein